MESKITVQLSVAFADPERTVYHAVCAQEEVGIILDMYQDEFLTKIQDENPDKTISVYWYRTSSRLSPPDTKFYLAQATMEEVETGLVIVKRLYYKI